ncbi:MAG: hypothetical protein JWQ42_1519 [Edaphobacter sp.]|nr:hypothetical protein [Edaphobacter sp.]
MQPLLPEDFFRQIGKVAVYYNQLENLINHTLIYALLGEFSEDGKALSVVIHMGFNQRLDALGAILRIIDDSDDGIAAAYRSKVLPQLKQSQEKRNIIIHQNLISQPDGIKRFDIKARGTLKYSLTNIDVQELRDAALFIAQTHSTLWSLVTVALARKEEPQQGQ